MALGKDRTRTRSFTVSRTNLRAMVAAQNFVSDNLGRSYTSKDYLEQQLSTFNGIVLYNVFGTESAATIAKNVMRVYNENRSLASQLKSDGQDVGAYRLQKLVDTADKAGATTVSVTAEYVRVYESAQSATLFTLIYDPAMTSMTLPGGQIITT